MSGDEYTPDRSMTFAEFEARVLRNPDVFQIWLATRIREAQAVAWDEGVEQGVACVYLESHGQCYHERDSGRQCRLRVSGTLNPYRTNERTTDDSQ